MTRALYNRQTLTIQPYNRQDDSPAVGPDRELFYVLQRIDEPPPQYDPTQETLSPADPVVAITDPDGDDLNGTVTYGWIRSPIVPPPPAPDWLGFAGWLYQFPEIAEAMAVARLSTEPQGEPATTGLLAAMDEARLRQNYPAFAQTWGQFLLASGMGPEALGQIVAKAAACHLPAPFIEALQPVAP